jgi:hypothetical protein
VVEKKTKKPTTWIWYDETRENPHSQISLKFCFIDVPEFKTGLRTFHIAQLMTFYYQRIVTRGSYLSGVKMVYMIASKIANDNFFAS